MSTKYCSNNLVCNSSFHLVNFCTISTGSECDYPCTNNTDLCQTEILEFTECEEWKCFEKKSDDSDSFDYGWIIAIVVSIFVVIPSFLFGIFWIGKKCMAKNKVAFIDDNFVPENERNRDLETQNDDVETRVGDPEAIGGDPNILGNQIFKSLKKFWA